MYMNLQTKDKEEDDFPDLPRENPSPDTTEIEIDVTL